MFRHVDVTRGFELSAFARVRAARIAVAALLFCLPSVLFAFPSGAPSCAAAIGCMGGSSDPNFVLEVLDPNTLLPLTSIAPSTEAIVRVRSANSITWTGLLLQSTTNGSFGTSTAGMFGNLPAGFRNGPCPDMSSVTQSTLFNGVSVDFPWMSPADPVTVQFIGHYIVGRFDAQNSIQVTALEVAAPVGPGNVEESLIIARSTTTPGDLVLSWNASCSSGAVDYAIYEGTLGDFTSHVSKVCSDSGGDFSEEITPAAGSTYYLLVATSGSDEGSYGVDSAGVERPTAALPADRCLPDQEVGACLP